MKKIILAICALLTFIASTMNTYAYGNVYAHPKINQTIVEEFQKRLASYMQSNPKFKKFEKYNIGLNSGYLSGITVTSPGGKYISTGIKSQTAKEWIQDGGYTADEPEWPAALRHFYDPTKNDGSLYLTDVGIFPGFINPCIDAVQWAFTGTDPAGNNEWTWNKGKEYLKLALETADIKKSEGYLAIAMRCLGEVLHNTADMALPAHVRNDAHGGYPGVGGTDPYEATYDFNKTAEWGAKKADPSLYTYFQAATIGMNINTELAKFTNKYFFSQETISGTGVQEFSSINKFPDYLYPKLQDFEYKEEDYAYYKTFPSGREVKMCVDRSLFLGYISQNFRASPRVSLSCVESQAQELIPNIVEAGVNLVRLFIPELSVSLKVDGLTGNITGNISHATDAEYTSSISYYGDVRIFVNSKLSSVIMKASYGQYYGHLDGLKKGDKVKATISFADITVNSTEATVGTVPVPTITSITPTKGGKNTVVTLMGSNFGNSAIVYYGTGYSYPTTCVDNKITFSPTNAISGKIKVWVKADNIESNKVDFEVLPGLKSLTLTPSTTLIPIGGSVQLVAVVKDENDKIVTDRTITWSTYSPTFLSLSNTGNATGLKAGTASVTATCEGVSGYAKICIFDPVNKFATSGTATGWGGLQIDYSIQGMAIDEYTDYYRTLKGYPLGSEVTVTFKVYGPYSIEGSWETNGSVTINGVAVETFRAPNQSGAPGWTLSTKPAIIKITDDMRKNGFSISANVGYARSSNAEFILVNVVGKGCK